MNKYDDSISLRGLAASVALLRLATWVGTTVGYTDGCLVGLQVGVVDGRSVGLWLGRSEGCVVGRLVGVCGQATIELIASSRKA